MRSAPDVDAAIGHFGTKWKREPGPFRLDYHGERLAPMPLEQRTVRRWEVSHERTESALALRLLLLVTSYTFKLLDKMLFGHIMENNY
jgi:hypothetical protein